MSQTAEKKLPITVERGGLSLNLNHQKMGFRLRVEDLEQGKNYQKLKCVGLGEWNERGSTTSCKSSNINFWQT